MQEKYVNPFTDFGFKKLFGEEPNKILLISFLNSLLPEKHQIKDLKYTQNEYQGYTPFDRKAIFDLSCISTTGERFIVELQKARQNYFKDRSLYYAAFAIQEQAQRGTWNYKLAAVYTIGILDFLFIENEQENNTDVIHTVQLKNQYGEVFYEKLTFIYLALPNFKKTLDQLNSVQDKWFYLFRHLHEFDEIPEIYSDHVFPQLFEVAKIACFNNAERKAYEQDLKHYRDLHNVTETAWEDGLEIGKKVGRKEGIREGEQQKALNIAKNLLNLLDDTIIAEKTGLSLEQIRQLHQDN
ncbi:MAG: Rpn family recombination-promoting nuclease/putative transposase [bacterium]